MGDAHDTQLWWPWGHDHSQVDTALPQSTFVQVGQKFPIDSITPFSRLFQSKPLSSPITPFHVYLSFAGSVE